MKDKTSIGRVILLVVALSTLINSVQGQLGNGLMNVVNGANEAIARPLTNALGSITNPILSPAASALGATNALNPMSPSLGFGAINGLASGAAAATSSLTGPNGVTGNLLGGILGGGSSSGSGASSASSSTTSSVTTSTSSSGSSASSASASPSGNMMGFNGMNQMQMMNGGAGMGLGYQQPPFGMGGASASSAAAAAGGAAAATSGASSGISGGLIGAGYPGAGLAGVVGAASNLGGSILGGAYGSLANGVTGASTLGAAQALGPTGELEAASLSASPLGAAAAAGAARQSTAAAAIEGAAVVGGALATNQLLGRETLAADAIGNAQAEAAIAGADMAAHGANNARSASLASNAYRQAKLAGARDRVNIAGTIQNSARISDAAIATHDSATKAEDSLLGSELAVDSAGTVLDSDAAYIPPVTSSLLRSLPYGRLGLRNILPRPLTYPSILLPDVWLNGRPVNYFNVGLRHLPYGAPFSGNQPFYSNNGALVNGLIFDPTASFVTSNMNGVVGSSVLPILANGQLEAQDEVAMSRFTTLQQQMGYGMGATYNGFNWVNPVPLLTGSVSDANLIPTTTIGTTYPIGSALVIEPRDSYFQDYIDSSSSRQNYDERQQ